MSFRGQWPHRQSVSSLASDALGHTSVSNCHRRGQIFAFWLSDYYTHGMDRPKAYAEHRFIGDKRTQLVYDLDAEYAQEVIDELVESEQVGTFGPDTLPEARNRGYRLAKAL